MEENVHKPESPLSSFVKFIWYNDGYEPSSRIERVLPTGSSQIIINLGKNKFRHFDKNDFDLADDHKEAILAGVHTGHLFLDSYTRISTMGVVLKNGAVPALFKIPAGEFRNRIVPLDEICNRDVSGLKQKLVAAPEPKTKFRILESFIERQLSSGYQTHPAIRFAIDQIDEHHGMISISGILNQTGYSQRWFSQIFRDTAGVNPKQYARICRFQHILSRLRKYDTTDWAGFALRYGYFDQAHLIHDFQDLAGITPSEYRQHYGEAVNHLTFHRS